MTGHPEPQANLPAWAAVPAADDDIAVGTGDHPQRPPAPQTIDELLSALDELVLLLTETDAPSSRSRDMYRCGEPGRRCEHAAQCPRHIVSVTADLYRGECVADPAVCRIMFCPCEMRERV